MFTLSRSRTLVATFTGAILALSGVAVMPTAQAANTSPDPDGSITPSSVLAGTTQTFRVSVEGTDQAKVQLVSVTVPAAFRTPTAAAWAVPSTWGASYDEISHTFTFSTTSPNKKLGTGDVVTAQITAQAPAASGNYTWTTTARDNLNGGGTTQVNPQPVVTVTKPDTSQTISFGTLANRTYGDAAFTVSATGGASGNPVTFSASGNCTSSGTNGATISITGAGSCTVTASQEGGNGYSAASPVSQKFDIAKANQIITFGGIDSQTYGGPPLNLDASSSSGLPVDFTASGQCTLDGTKLSLSAAGDCSVTAAQGGDADYNAATPVTRSFTIAKASAVMSLSGLQYTYDGNSHHATASTEPGDLSGVTITYSQNGKVVTNPTRAGSYDVTATLDNANYAAEALTGTLVIDPKPIAGSFTVRNRSYDGTTDAVIDSCSLPATDVVGTDAVTLDCSVAAATFDSADAGDRTATISGAELAGADRANYVLTGIPAATATIDPATVTGSVTAADKNYDGTRAAVATPAGLSGVIGSDDVQLSVDSATFDTKDVGTGKTVTALVKLTGAAAVNYALTCDTATATANVWAKLLVGSFAAEDKVYDGTTNATVHPNNPLAGVIGTEDVALDVTDATFDSKVVGTRTVTGTLGLIGADAGNYAVDPERSSSTASAHIFQRTVTGSFTAADKVWDGTVSATITGRSLDARSADTGQIDGDDVSLSGGTATFSDPSVGTKQVTGTGFILSGNDAGNYELADTTLTTTASITPLYSGTGFYAPVNMSPEGSRVWNTIRGGQTVPLKFEVFNAKSGGEQTSLSVFGPDAASQASAFKMGSVACTSTGSTTDAVEITTTGGTSLRYDTTAGQYVQNWKTPTTVGSCYAVTVKTVDGTTVGPAYFKITK